MQNLGGSREMLYTGAESGRLINKYNRILGVFRRKFRSEWMQKYGLQSGDKIVDIQRGLIDGDNKVFWDYLGATHNSIQNIPSIAEKFNSQSSFRCIKLTFGSGKTLTLEKSALRNQAPEWVISLDGYYLQLNEFERKDFDRIFLLITEFESKHFHSLEYQETFNKIKKESQDELFQALNLTEG